MKKKTFTTEEVLQGDLRTVQTACITNQILHLSRCFTGAPGHSGVVTTSVTCPDDLALELHVRLDALVQAFFAEHDIHPEPLAPVI
jgi:hypothetical protein